MQSKGLLLFALIIALVAVSSRSLVKLMEPRILYHPTIGLTLSPKFYKLDFKDVVIKSGEYNIHGWYFPGQKNKRIVVFYHGNAGNMAGRLEFIKFLQPLGLNILMIDYRGYGRSEGVPSAEGIHSDALAALEWLTIKQKVPPRAIILWGRSLGGAAALYAAQRNPYIAGVIVESSFLSIRRIAMELFPWVPVAFVTDIFDNASIVGKLAVPKLFIHGMNDTLIPFSHSEELFRRSAEPKQIVPVKGAGHNDVYARGGDKYLEVVGKWIDHL